MNVLDFKKLKLAKQKIAMVTVYDYTSARITADSNVDVLLVGDSAAMTMHGHSSTLPATVEMMTWHTASVVRGAPNKFIVADLPFMSYRKSLSENIEATEALMRAGAHAVKLEGVAGNEDYIRHLVESGVPVMGHIGLTPQSVNQLGGYRVQGRERSEADRLVDAAKKLEAVGAFSVVLECVPNGLARQITEALQIPTIGIGAGPDTDGQVLVWQDLLGLNKDFRPKFVRPYANAAETFTEALNHYTQDVQAGLFPSPAESYE